MESISCAKNFVYKTILNNERAGIWAGRRSKGGSGGTGRHIAGEFVSRLVDATDSDDANSGTKRFGTRRTADFRKTGGCWLLVFVC